MAGAALEGAGLRHDDAGAHYSALIHARVATELPPWVDPWYLGAPWWGPGFGGASAWGAAGYGRGWRGHGWYGGGWYGPMFPAPENPWFAREVSIVLRELPSNRVVYETHARNAGPYSTSADILPVMFRAALQGFPNPPSGERDASTSRSRGQRRPPPLGRQPRPPRICAMEPTRVIAVRHGETAWNVDTRIQGQLDIGLNDTGLWQAARVGQALEDEPIAAIYASDLSRAWQTAQAIAGPHEHRRSQPNRACANGASAISRAAPSPTSTPRCRPRHASGARAIPSSRREGGVSPCSLSGIA